MRLFWHDRPFLSERAIVDLGLERAVKAALGDEAQHVCRFFQNAPADARERERRRELFDSLDRDETSQAFLRAVQVNARELAKLHTHYGASREADALYWLRFTQSYTAAISALAAMAVADSRPCVRITELLCALQREYASESFRHLQQTLRRVEQIMAPWRETCCYWQKTHAQFTVGAWESEAAQPLCSENISATLLRLFGDAPCEAPRAGTLAQADMFWRQLCARESVLQQEWRVLMQEARQYDFCDLQALAHDVRIVWGVLTLIKHWRDRGVPLCKATVIRTDRITITQGVDVSLLDRVEHVVPNSFDESASVSLLHGANSGGKTAFMRMVGQCAAMAILGLPAPASMVCVPPIDTIRSVFTGEESLSRGRLFAENDALCEAVDGMGPETLLLINEVFSSTNEQEAIALSQRVLYAVLQAGARCLWNTHHTLPLLASKMPCATYAPLVCEDGTRCYVLQRQTRATSHASDIAARYGLRGEQITARLRERGVTGEEK